MKYEPNDIKRFLTSFEIDDISGCWIWLKGLDRDGYGKFTVKHKTIRPHRMAWELINGVIPDGLLILHTCDNPSCVNPMHLWLGTQQDNIADKVAKKREAHNIGEKGGNHKLTQQQVDCIRKRYQGGGVLQEELAQEYRISARTINDIVNYRSWYDV